MNAELNKTANDIWNGWTTEQRADFWVTEHRAAAYLIRSLYMRGMMAEDVVHVTDLLLAKSRTASLAA